MKVKGIIVMVILLASSLGLPMSNGMVIGMQASGETALLGLCLLLAFTPFNSTSIYETPELSINYIHLKDVWSSPMFVIETTHHNISSTIDFYAVINGTATKFGAVGINIAPSFIWVDFPDPEFHDAGFPIANMTWKHFEFPIQEAEE